MRGLIILSMLALTGCNGAETRVIDKCRSALAVAEELPEDAPVFDLAKVSALVKEDCAEVFRDNELFKVLAFEQIKQRFPDVDRSKFVRDEMFVDDYEGAPFLSWHTVEEYEDDSGNSIGTGGYSVTLYPWSFRWEVQKIEPAD